MKKFVVFLLVFIISVSCFTSCDLFGEMHGGSDTTEIQTPDKSTEDEKDLPSDKPAEDNNDLPSDEPTDAPSDEPTDEPTDAPSDEPTDEP